jgi:hypothetical protein
MRALSVMAHLLHVLAQHWHLSASQYWQLRLLCAVSLGPLLGVLCLVLFKRKLPLGTGVTRIKRHIKSFALPSAVHPPLRPTANRY